MNYPKLSVSIHERNVETSHRIDEKQSKKIKEKEKENNKEENERKGYEKRSRKGGCNSKYISRRYTAILASCQVRVGCDAFKAFTLFPPWMVGSLSRALAITWAYKESKTEAEAKAKSEARS